MTTHSSTPKGRVAATWQSRFVLGNTVANANRLHFLSQEWGGGMTETPVWDPVAWWDTSADVTGLAATRNSLIIFHEGTVERLRGTKAPGSGVEPDLWMEPLIGLGGCNEPHTICYWNDNVIFADARGVYLTDGTTIRDITSQGGVGREWRKAYDPAWRVAGGVVYDSYVVAMVDTVDEDLQEVLRLRPLLAQLDGLQQHPLRLVRRLDRRAGAPLRRRPRRQGREPLGDVGRRPTRPPTRSTATTSRCAPRSRRRGTGCPRRSG